eukprot:6912784-Prymnesium_polylepis.1
MAFERSFRRFPSPHRFHRLRRSAAPRSAAQQRTTHKAGVAAHDLGAPVRAATPPSSLPPRGPGRPRARDERVLVLLDQATPQVQARLYRRPERRQDVDHLV